MTISKSYRAPRDWEYGDIARNVIAGKGFSRISDPGGVMEPTSSHAPLYIFFLAFFYRMGTGSGTFIFIQLLQIALSTATAFILYRLTRLVFDHKSALGALFIASFYPPLVYYSVKIVPTTLFVFLLLLGLWLIIGIRKRAWLRVISGGCVLGLTFLCNAAALVMYPVLILWSLLMGRDRFREIGIAIITSCVLILPYTIRNYRVHRALVPITTQFGINFWIGNNPRATGTDYYRVQSVEQDNFVLMTQTLSRLTKEQLNSMEEMERSRFFFREGMRFIRAHPHQACSLLLKKMFYYWWFPPLSINASPDANRYRTITILVYLPLALAALIGIGFALHDRRTDLTLLLLFTAAAYSTVFISTHVGLLRYRLPVESILIVFAGITLARAFSIFHGGIKGGSSIDSGMTAE